MAGEYRVRFAPSPTGHLHVGGARTCFFNWLFAKKMHGALIVRIEDTDQVRSTPESERKILHDLEALGLDYMEGPFKEGPYSPYRQSERLTIYEKMAQRLLENNKAYWCFCSEELLTQKRELALKVGQPPHYDGTCAHLTPQEVKQRMDQGEKASLRFRAIQKIYSLSDLVRKDVYFQEHMVGDFLITRTQKKEEKGTVFGFPVYNFCCVVDDALMQITHVIRAEEHLSNTVRQLMLYEALELKPPQFAHISLILGADRQKLSKRSGDVSVDEYLKKGYLPEALLNFLLLLGWAPKSEIKTQSGHPEIFSLQEMIEYFSLEGLQRAGAVFDVQKLNWMNSYYIGHMDLEELEKKVRPFFKNAENLDRAVFQKILQLVRTDCTTLMDFELKSDFILQDNIVLGELEQKFLKEHQQNCYTLAVFLQRYLKEAVLDEHFFNDLLTELKSHFPQLKGKGLFVPLRVLLTGRLQGPELKLCIPLISKKRLLQRLEFFLEMLK